MASCLSRILLRQFKNAGSCSVHLSRQIYPTCHMILVDAEKTLVHINEAEISEVIDLSALKEDLTKALDQLKESYVKNLSLRSSAGTIENLPVEFEGELYPLQELAQVARKGPQLMIVNASSFPQVVPSMLKAIQNSGMGLNPQQDGTTISIALPKVTKEHRENLAKNAKSMFHKYKDSLRDIHNRHVRDVKKKDKLFSSDLIFSVLQQIQALTEQYSADGEKTMLAKQNELLGRD
nr:EOG090X0DUK [Leptodora kindtii]